MLQASLSRMRSVGSRAKARLLDKAASLAIGKSPRFSAEYATYTQWRNIAELIEAILAEKRLAAVVRTVADEARALPAVEFALESLNGSKNVAVGSSNAAVREAWVKNSLKSLPAGARLLDAGAGECQFKKYCDHLQYVSQDINEYTGEGDHAGLQMGQWNTSGIDIVSDIVAIPEPTESFDAVICTEVLEHITDVVPALEELARLLKVGGTLILTAPFCSLTHFSPYHYTTGFNRSFYLHHLSRLGLEVVELTENGNYFEYVAQEIRRIEDVARRYEAGQVSPSENHALQVALGVLNRMSSADQGSKELLHFGFHVRARKVKQS
jgi:ubiquinone/menaquinone biosynthesis C-methylase UbiE